MSDLTRILNAIEKGDPHAAEQLLPLVYDELRKLAGQKLAAETPGQTLQATALVHEGYLRLVGGTDQPWSSRGHFLCAAAEAMRRILVEQARRKGSVKHGGGRRRVDLAEVTPAESQSANDDFLAINDALTRLAQQEPARAELVKRVPENNFSISPWGRDGPVVEFGKQLVEDDAPCFLEVLGDLAALGVHFVQDVDHDFQAGFGGRLAPVVLDLLQAAQHHALASAG